MWSQGLAAALVFAAAPVETSTATQSDEDYRFVDMVVATVDQAIVTYSELLSEARLLLLETRGPQVAVGARLNRDLLRAVLRSIVHRELLLGEIRRLQLRPVAGSEVDKRLIALRRRFDDEAGWRRFLREAGFRNLGDENRRVPETLRARLRAEAQVDRFLDVRIRLNVVVTDVDIARCYRARGAAFGGASRAVVAPRIEAQIRRQRETAALAELLDQLGDRAEIRYDPDFEPERSVEPVGTVRAPGSGFSCPL